MSGPTVVRLRGRPPSGSPNWATNARSTSAQAVLLAIGAGDPDAAGQFRQGFTFDGNGDYVNVPNNTNLQFTTGMTALRADRDEAADSRKTRCAQPYGGPP